MAPEREPDLALSAPAGVPETAPMGESAELNEGRRIEIMAQFLDAMEWSEQWARWFDQEIKREREKSAETLCYLYEQLERGLCVLAAKLSPCWERIQLFRDESLSTWLQDVAVACFEFLRLSKKLILNLSADASPRTVFRALYNHLLHRQLTEQEVQGILACLQQPAGEFFDKLTIVRGAATLQCQVPPTPSPG